MTCFQIVQIDQESKKYIMDTSTMSPKSYYWGIKTDTITVDMVEIEKNNNQFEIKPTTPVSTTMAAIIVQPIVKVGYDVLKRLFIQNNLSEQVLLKLLLFAISMLISYFAKWNRRGFFGNQWNRILILFHVYSRKLPNCLSLQARSNCG